MVHPNVYRVIAAVTVGIMASWWIRLDYAKWARLGREAFMVHEGHRFDTYMAVPHAPSVTIFATTLLVLMAIGLYELIALALAKGFKSAVSSTTPS